jgi:hypothetical protein
MTPVLQSDGKVRPKSVWTLRSSARRPAAGGAWRSSTGAASSPAGTAIRRATRRADRLRARLGWEPGILNGEGCKPKWMRWRTFERLAAEYDQFVGRSMQAAVLKFGPLVSDFRF